MSMSSKKTGTGYGKRLISLLTAVSITAALIPVSYLNVFAAGEFSGGSGTAADPYIIETADNLRELAAKVNAGEEAYATAYYTMPTETYTYTDKGVEYTNGVRAISIDLSDDNAWTPIGTEEHPFKGHFSGSNDKNRGNGSYGKIYNYKLQIDKQEITAPNRRVHAVGLFGYVDGATIENVNTAGLTIGDSDNNINLNTYNTYADGTKSYHCIGGLVGFAKDSTIKFCTTYSPLAVRAAMGENGGATPELYVGGVVGGESGSEIFRCVNNSVINAFYTEDGFDGNNVTDGKRLPDAFVGGIVGGVNGISEKASKIHGSENMSEVVIYVPHVKNADNIKLFAGGIVGGISDVEKDKLELCQDYNRSANARVRVTNSPSDSMQASNAVTGAGGIFGYDDAEKKVHVHDCKNDAAISNLSTLTTDSKDTLLYSAGIVAGRGNVDNCYNIATIQSLQTDLSSGICYSVPHHCYSTGMVAGQPICVEVPEDTDTKYYNYFTNAYQAQEKNHPNWQCYISDAQLINNGGLTWLLQGDQDPNYLHWTATAGAPLLGGGYYVKTGGRPLDYWLNKGWGAYNNDMGREIVAFAPAWSYRIRKYRYVTTGEGNDGVDPVTGDDLKTDTSFASFEKSDTSQFYAIGYGYYCGRIGALPTVTATDEKTFVQWQATPAASEGAATNLGSAFSYSGANSTVYAVARVKFGAKDDDGVYRSVYGDGNTIDNLNNDVYYGAEPDETVDKFTYSLSEVTTGDEALENAEDYFDIDSETLKVAKNTPAGVYTVTVEAAEKSQNITLFSTGLGFEPVQFTINVEVIKTDPVYTAPQRKKRVYDGTSEDVITAGSTADGTILYTYTPNDDSSWSENVPMESEVGLYTVYWKIVGDSNHNDRSVDVLSGVITPDADSNPIIVTPTADWTYDGTTKDLADVVNPQSDYVDIEWSTDNENWTPAIPTGRDAGEYPVYWRVKENNYGIDLKGNFTVKVSKAKLNITPPTGLKLSYNGTAQELITEGSADKGTMKYSLTPWLNDWTNWSEAVPERTNAGTYNVYYRAFPNDLNNYVDTFDTSDPTYVTAEILKLTRADLGDKLKVVPADGWTYDKKSHPLVKETVVPTDMLKGLRIMYSTDNGASWDYQIPSRDNAGDYTVKWKTVGNDNVEDITDEFTVHVAKKTPVIEITPKADWVYDGKTYPLLTVTKNDDNMRFNYSVNGGEAQTTVPYGQNVDTYRVSVTSVPNDNYETYQGTFEIECTPASTSGDVTANNLTFNYGAQALVEPTGVTNGKMMYYVGSESPADKAEYSDAIPMRTDAGTYKVWYYVKGNDANYADTEPASVDVTIDKLDPNPTVNKSTGLVYNKGKQTLLTVDTEGHHGTVQYAVKTDETAPSDGDWKTDVPKRENAGEYKVYWRVVDDSGRADGETNLIPRSDSETVTIDKYPATIAYVHAEDLPYTGEPQELVEEIKARNGMGTVKYVLTDGSEPSESDDWKDEIPTGTNAGAYTVWFKIVGDENIEDVEKQRVVVNITRVVPKISVTVKGALKYNAAAAQNLIAYVNVDAGVGGGKLMYAVTTDASATAKNLEWSENEPEKKDSDTYYVWYRFDGDDNTESIDAKKATSVIAGDIPDVTVSGKHLDYTGEAQKLIEGKIDGANIEHNANVKYHITENASETFTVEQALVWDTAFPEKTDAKKYYVWYYVPEEGSNLAVGPAMIEAEIRKKPKEPYDYTKNPDEETVPASDGGTVTVKVKHTPEGDSFIVPYGTKLGDIELRNSPNGTYAWLDYVENRVLENVGGPYNYPAYFTADASGNYESGIVQIAVTITKIPEPTPNIGIDYINEKLTGFDPSKTYTIWDGEHTDSTTLDIAENYMTGDSIKYPIVLKASTNHTTDSDPQELVIPTRPPAPEKDTAGAPITVHQPEYLTAWGRVDGVSDEMEYSFGDIGTWIAGSGDEISVPQNATLKVRYKAVAETATQQGSFKSFELPIPIEDFAKGRKQVTFDIVAAINYPDHAIVLEPNTKYTIIDQNGVKHRVESDKNGEVPIEEDWHNETIPVQIIKNGDILYTVDSDPFDLIIPLRPVMDPLPGDDEGKIIDVSRLDEYRPASGKDTDYKDVENNTSTNEVTPGEYVVRVKATQGSFSSLPAPVTVREKTPKAEIDYVKETLKNLVPDSEYIITEPDGNVITVVTDSNGEIPIKDGWFGEKKDGVDYDKTLKIVKKGATEAQNSKEQSRLIPPRPNPPTPESEDGKIIEVNNKTMEYRLASDTGAEEYKKIENDTETKVVAADNYEVRYKAVVNTSFASLPARIKVEPMPAPDGKIDYKEVKIKDLVPGAEYTIIDEYGNEEIITAGEDGKIPIKEKWIDTEIEIIRNGDEASEDSDAQTISIPKRPDPPKPSSKDSKITEVDDTMEYRPKDDTDDKYVPVEDGKTESPVVTPGEYAVRYEATEDSFPSLPAYVTVDPLPDSPATPEPTPGTTHKGGSGGSSKSTPAPSPTPSTAPDGDNSGGGRDVPELNKTDHFAYISGYEDDTFRPDTTIRRGEVAAIFARLMTDSMNTDKTYTPSFPDLTPDMYFYSQVGYLEKYGIITGYEDGTFRPWENVTRTEFSVIASKFAELIETEDNVFSDVDDDFWGKPFILLAHKNGWVNGYEDGTFKPNASITRAEVVSIVNRMLERSCDIGFAQSNADKMKAFGDVSASHWAYNDILEAANGHLYTAEDGSEVWTDLI